jgi:PIN domain nuclease of toxin-antitoxin system
MKYLIDSHVALWLVLQPNQVKENIRNLILNNENDIFISLVSFWEISIKYNLGKLVINGASPEIFSQELSKACKVKTLNLTLEDTLSFHKLKTLHHKDPFDRMMIWQAIKNDLTFITDDVLIHKYTDIGLKVVW